MVDLQAFEKYPGIRTFYERCCNKNRFLHYGPDVYLQTLPAGLSIGKVRYADTVSYTIAPVSPTRHHPDPKGIWRFYFSVDSRFYFDQLSQLILLGKIPKAVLDLIDQASAEFVLDSRYGLA